MISSVQLQKITHFFHILDVNKNQVLQLDDFRIVASKICDAAGFQRGSVNYEKIIRQSYRIFIQILTDVEKEDEMEIKEDEWIRFFEIHLNPQKETDDTLIQGYVNRIVHYIFNLYDHNLDGYISREEYKLMFSIYHIDPTTSEESFSKLDLNNDNKISKTELISSLTEFFTSSDPQTTGNWIFGPVKFT